MTGTVVIVLVLLPTVATEMLVQISKYSLPAESRALSLERVLCTLVYSLVESGTLEL
jgi:hypothetical protein